MGVPLVVSVGPFSGTRNDQQLGGVEGPGQSAAEDGLVLVHLEHVHGPEDGGENANPVEFSGGNIVFPGLTGLLGQFGEIEVGQHTPRGYKSRPRHQFSGVSVEIPHSDALDPSRK